MKKEKRKTLITDLFDFSLLSLGFSKTGIPEKFLKNPQETQRQSLYTPIEPVFSRLAKNKKLRKSVSQIDTLTSPFNKKENPQPVKIVTGQSESIHPFTVFFKPLRNPNT